MTNMTNMTKLEILASKLYLILTTVDKPESTVADLIIDLGKELAAIPYISDCKGPEVDLPKWIAVSRAELEYIHKALEDALATPSEELLPDSVTHAESMLFKILTRIVSKSAWNANETNERNEN